MEISLSLTIDSHSMGESEAQKKSILIRELFEQINSYIKIRDYGNGVYKYLIILYVANPPKGWEHLYKDFKPKYTHYKLLTNKFTGTKLEIEKQFDYSLKINDKLFETFTNSTDEESKKLLAQEILKSLSNLDALPKKVKAFDKERFKIDMENFFKEQNLI